MVLCIEAIELKFLKRFSFIVLLIPTLHINVNLIWNLNATFGDFFIVETLVSSKTL